MKNVIIEFDKFLNMQGLSFEAIIIGGAALNILDRADFLKSKLFAYCDRTTPDFEDLKNLKPSVDELGAAIDWVKERDTHANWVAHVEKAFSVLRRALGYE